MATRTAPTRRRRARTQSRTKQVVKLIKHSDYNTMDVVQMFIPEAKFKQLDAKAQSEVIKLGSGMIDVVRAGQFDLRQAM